MKTISVSFLIMPLFALANTGITLPHLWYYNLVQENSLGILLGLVIGKPLGIMLFCWAIIKLKFAALPDQATWKMLLAAGMLAGIGFTMSIFIAQLAFTDSGFVAFSKVSVLIASFIAALLGLLTLFRVSKNKLNSASN